MMEKTENFNKGLANNPTHTSYSRKYSVKEDLAFNHTLPLKTSRNEIGINEKKKAYTLKKNNRSKLYMLAIFVLFFSFYLANCTYMYAACTNMTARATKPF